MHYPFFSLLVGSFFFFASCDEVAEPTDGVVPGKVSGMVVNTKGQPMPNTKIIVDNTVYYNSGLSGKTNEEGRYELTVPQGSWRVYAETEITYNGKKIALQLAPDNPESFTATEGAVRNFRMKLRGEKPAPMVGHYGFLVYAYPDVDNGPLYMNNVEFTFTPISEMIDGTQGQTLVTKVSDGYLYDIPLAKYRISAQYLHDDGSTAPLVVRVRNSEEYQAQTVADFRPDNFCDLCMRLEVAWP